jgi:hypothetical protein
MLFQLTLAEFRAAQDVPVRIEIFPHVCWLVPGGQMAHYLAVNTPPAHLRNGIAAENRRLAERANAHLLAILAPRIQGEDTSTEKTS